MPLQHTVLEGEHLGAIAGQYGFADPSVVWNDPGNAELKQRRGSGAVLLPGDTVVIPEKAEKRVSGATGQRHTFQLAQQPILLQLLLGDALRKPVASGTCAAGVDGTQVEATVDGNGALQIPITPRTSAVTLNLASPDTAYQDEVLTATVGELDPADSFSGQIGRLRNLGYLVGVPATEADPDFRSAVEEFQCDNALPVNGEAGSETQAKLRQVHGC